MIDGELRESRNTTMIYLEKSSHESVTIDRYELLRTYEQHIMI